MIVPMRSKGMPPGTLRVPLTTQDVSPCDGDAERHRMHSHAEHGNDQVGEIAAMGHTCAVPAFGARDQKQSEAALKPT